MAITVEDLIKQKCLIEERENETITLSVKDMGEFEFRVPTAADISDMEAYRDGTMAEPYLVSACSTNPRFSDKALLDAYEAFDGPEAVKKIFRPGHVRWLSLNLLKAAGYDEQFVEVVENTKN